MACPFHDAFPRATLGYCTNVHPGRSLDELKEQLEQHAVAVKRSVSPDEPLPVGLWFSQAVAESLDPDRIGRQPAWDFKRWLDARGLAVFTLNGFPQHDFHQPVVKHAVYEPNWETEARRDHTLALVRILDALLPPGKAGSISTLPVAWDLHDEDDDRWIDHLFDVVDVLEQLEQSTGRLIHLDLEPEPGCFIEDTLTLDTTAQDLDAACETDAQRATLRRYLRVCLDVCHGAVMFEPADHLLRWCRRTGWQVGKVQISNAVRVRWKHSRGGNPRGSNTVAEGDALQALAEPRYLHQTTCGHPGRHCRDAFFEDLPDAIEAFFDDEAAEPTEWRVHFHVPIHRETLGPLRTTRSEIVKLLQAIRPDDGIEHFEVETYAWDVLPEEHRPNSLAEGIAAELAWVRSLPV